MSLLSSLLLLIVVSASAGDVKDPDFAAHPRDAFTSVFERLRTLFRPEIAATGKTMHLRRVLIGNANNSWFVPAARKHRIEFSLPRRDLQTYRQVAFTLCHEFGHALGGAPYFMSGRFPVAYEAQADYFATAKCVRRLWEHEDNEAALRGLNLDPRTDILCREVYLDPAEYWLCRRSLHAAVETARMLQGRRGSVPDLDSPARAARISVSSYPSAQCRLDTMVAGALCPVDPTLNFDSRDLSKGACQEGTRGGRPPCWFVPGKYPSLLPEKTGRL